MAPLVLEGATLGKRHQHYNQLLKDVTSTRKAEPTKIDYNKTDIENLFNIDLASKNRDVEYILDVFRCEDMLYVSRAIKRSTWLFTDAQYDHIIDPEYLHSQLFPQMMPKASCKLLLHIRLTLKDESRVDKFFQYFKEKDLKTASKWLPNCSIHVIEDVVKKHALDISSDIFGRLCRRSPRILEIFVNATQRYDYRTLYFNASMFLLRSNTELYLDALEKNDKYIMSIMDRKHTEIVMKKCPQRIINNFQQYIYCIDVDTFAKNLKKEEIKSFIVKQLEYKDLKCWFDQERLGQFIKYMPNEDKYGFMKQFIDKTAVTNDDSYGKIYQCAMSCPVGTNKSNTYRWYKYAPFGVAFPELKKLIRTESNPDERNAMLMILAANAGKNLVHIHTLLQYYREKHINEPFRFKVQFVNEFIQQTNPLLYDDKTWSILDELFRSMEVYIESENNVQTCIKAIIVYKVTHDEPVPAIIEQKCNFDFLKPYQRKLNGAQKEKLFNYLFNLLMAKLNNHVISNQAELEEYVKFLVQGLKLLKDWEKELVDYPVLTDKIKDCVRIKEDKGWSTSLTALYDTKKAWRKTLFEESLGLSPSHKVCMNALKHDPDLLVRHKNEVDALCCNDTIPMEKVLGKLRVYWSQTKASEWTVAYRERLDKPGGHKSLVRGLFCLLNHQQLLDLLKKYEPQETKINWVDADELQLSLRKKIAQSMHIARPQVSPDAVLCYAKGDYVQFTQPSLNSILYNLRPSHSRECIQKLLNGNVSLQKHGIHLAFAKLSTADMKTIFEDVWKTTKNSTVRALLFHNTHKMLCKENDELLVAELWELMQTFIESLTTEENKVIYNTFGKLAKVHHSIKPAYCMKGYRFLKSLPPKADCNNVIQKMKEEISNIIEQLEPDFVQSITEEFVNEVIIKKSYGYKHMPDMSILTSYVLNAKDESTLTERFENVFVPLIDKSMSSWAKINERKCFVRHNISRIVEKLIQSTENSFLKNKAKPGSLYQNILKKLEKSLPTTQNIILFRQLKLAAAFVDILDKNKPESTLITEKAQLDDLYSSCLSDIGKMVIQYLKDDVHQYETCLYEPLAEALDNVLDYFNISTSTRLKYFKFMLSEQDFIPICLLVIKVLPSYFVDDQKEDTKEIREILISHPSPIVQIHYYMKFGMHPIPFPGDELLYEP